MVLKYWITATVLQCLFLCRLSPLLVVSVLQFRRCGREHDSVEGDVLNYVSNLCLFLHRKALVSWSNTSNLVLLGSTSAPRLPIFSFLVRHPIAGVFLHHNYVCALLNDLFGIQARGGCACAGPYAQVSAILVLIIVHFRVTLCLRFKTSLRA